MPGDQVINYCGNIDFRFEIIRICANKIGESIFYVIKIPGVNPQIFMETNSFPLKEYMFFFLIHIIDGFPILKDLGPFHHGRKKVRIL